MKRYVLCTLVLGCATAFAGSQALALEAPSSAQTSGDQSQMDQSQMGQGHGDQAQMDKHFLYKAAEGNMYEIKTGHLAAEKSNNPQIKAFGEKMVRDHTHLNDSMMPFAQKYGVTPPDHLDQKDQAEYDRLSGLSGTEFDKAYLRNMVMDHRMDLHKFRHEIMTTTDPQLKQAVENGEMVVEQHLRIATHLAMQNGVDVPQDDMNHMNDGNSPAM